MATKAVITQAMEWATTGRHDATRHIAQFFTYDHLIASDPRDRTPDGGQG